jgi:hypothetical protein
MHQTRYVLLLCDFCPYFPPCALSRPALCAVRVTCACMLHLSLVQWTRVCRPLYARVVHGSSFREEGNWLDAVALSVVSAFRKIEGLKGFALCAQRVPVSSSFIFFAPLSLLFFCSVIIQHCVLTRPPSPQAQTPPTTVPFTRRTETSDWIDAGTFRPPTFLSSFPFFLSLASTSSIRS